MSKKTTKKHKPEPKRESVAKPVGTGMKIIGYIGAGILMLFLAVNIAVSQMIHPLYQGVVDGNKLSLVTFFKIAKNLNAFQPLKPQMQTTYQSLLTEIEGEQITRQEKLKKVEALLVQYPQSPDLLYAASVLARDTGNKEKAAQYLDQARKIDPQIGNN